MRQQCQYAEGQAAALISTEPGGTLRGDRQQVVCVVVASEGKAQSAMRLMHAACCHATSWCSVALNKAGSAGQELLAMRNNGRWVLCFAEPQRSHPPVQMLSVCTS